MEQKKNAPLENGKLPDEHMEQAGGGMRTGYLCCIKCGKKLESRFNDGLCDDCKPPKLTLVFW